MKPLRFRPFAGIAALMCLACSSGEGGSSESTSGSDESSEVVETGLFLPERRPRREGVGEPRSRYDLKGGYWRLAPEATPDNEIELVQRLEALGYASGTMEVDNADVSVSINKPEAFDGVTLVVSGHGGEAELVGMRGESLHRWQIDFVKTFPERAKKAPKTGISMRKVELLPDGRLLAIWEGQALVLLSPDSEILWKSSYRAHHDVRFHDGDVYVLTREINRPALGFGPTPFLEDFLSIVDLETGIERRRISILKALRKSPFEYLYVPEQTVYGDLLHTNSIQVLSGNAAHIDPAFRAGNVLLSIPLHDLVAVLDIETERMVWAHVAGFVKQHDAQILYGKTLLMLDNRGVPERSRAIEYDLATRLPVWSYGGSEAEPLDTPCCGAAQRLPNGNTLITETEFGRAVEVTRDGDIVWEYINPNRAGPNGKYIAVLFEARRFARDYVTSWLPEASR